MDAVILLADCKSVTLGRAMLLPLEPRNTLATFLGLQMLPQEIVVLVLESFDATFSWGNFVWPLPLWLYTQSRFLLLFGASVAA